MTDHDPRTDEEFAADSFRQLQPAVPSAQLLRSVAQIPLKEAQTSLRWWWPFESFALPSMALVAAAALGFALGGLPDAGDLSSGASAALTAEDSALVEQMDDPSVQAASSDAARDAELDAELEETLAFALGTFDYDLNVETL